ncbi:8-oxoguanine DNA glycosylase N-terminal [Penicillium lagena]|uniref:8-oxoguanine DNA glycosylase N-terminal n=1 Tax=Penicillium lagena TaxID=94218 RepID=UPI002540F5CA|nr:8-oxoguanine DNA glycosylase N-terminal [Penicillium lagena]KAJ5619508.1 8-oxoguanine DNA glycosylase N-terminal [Penicillium lagena]
MVFTEWKRLPISLGELCINTTLRCGQSFRWHHIPESEEWRCVLYGHLLSLKQDSNYLYYRTLKPPPRGTHLPTPPASEIPSRAESDSDSVTVSRKTQDDDHILHIIKHYFNLSINLSDLYSQWSSQDPNFKKKAAQFTGIRILRQNAWEALVSFICSSNNNIARISQMVAKLCTNYGPYVATVDEHAYHDFPVPEALAGNEVEGNLRTLGFGYRAKYIWQTALMVSADRPEGWLDGLSNPESPAFGVEPRPADEMQPEGRQGYRDAHEKLLDLQGVGPKVADCVSLMGLGWGESVPVDTHGEHFSIVLGKPRLIHWVVWQIAQRDYRFGKGSNKSLTKATYDAVGNHFRNLWGKEAGWAHSVLFTADLRSFADRLEATKKVKVEARDVKNEDEVEIKTEVETAVALKLLKEEGEAQVKVEDAEGGTEKNSKKRKKPNAIVHASQTTETRRVSKRLRSG